MKDPHLTDDALVALHLDGPTASGSSDHVAACPTCEGRLTSIATLLDDVTKAAHASADAAFPPERLARQRVRILQRIDQHAGGGRVLAFPAARAEGPSPVHLRPSPVRRWIAAAAAAGLFVGMLAGHLAHQLPVLREAETAAPAPALNSAPLLAATGASAADDEFLREIQRAVNRSGPVAFGRLDEVTPVAWEVR